MKLNKTFIIRHKETKEIFHASSGKSGWREAGHAKLAFGNSIQGARWTNATYILGKYGLKQSDFKYKGDGNYDYRFDGQGVYEIVELKHKSGDQLKKAIELLKVVIDKAAMNSLLYSEIDEFIKEVEIE